MFEQDPTHRKYHKVDNQSFKLNVASFNRQEESEVASLFKRHGFEKHVYWYNTKILTFYDTDNNTIIVKKLEDDWWSAFLPNEAEEWKCDDIEGLKQFLEDKYPSTSIIKESFNDKKYKSINDDDHDYIYTALSNDDINSLDDMFQGYGYRMNSMSWYHLKYIKHEFNKKNKYINMTLSHIFRVMKMEDDWWLVHITTTETYTFLCDEIEGVKQLLDDYQKEKVSLVKENLESQKKYHKFEFNNEYVGDFLKKYKSIQFNDDEELFLKKHLTACGFEEYKKSYDDSRHICYRFMRPGDKKRLAIKVTVMISKREDDWYIVWTSSKHNSWTFYACDEWQGLLELLEDLSLSDFSYPDKVDDKIYQMTEDKHKPISEKYNIGYKALRNIKHIDIFESNTDGNEGWQVVHKTDRRFSLKKAEFNEQEIKEIKRYFPRISDSFQLGGSDLMYKKAGGFVLVVDKRVDDWFTCLYAFFHLEGRYDARMIVCDEFEGLMNCLRRFDIRDNKKLLEVFKLDKP